MSVDNQVIIGGIVNKILLQIDFRERQTLLEEAQEVLRRDAEYTEPTDMVQRVCAHPRLNIALQKQITDLQAQRFLPSESDHSILERQAETLRKQLEEARRVARVARTDEQLQQELPDMTRDAR